MRTLVLWWLALLLMGCEAFSDLRVVSRDGGLDLHWSESLREDMTISRRCLAAQGLAGKLLKELESGQDFCIDFGSGTVTDAELAAHGWQLTASATGCQGFSSEQGRLTIKAPTPTIYADCQARLPALLVPSDTTKIVVSIVHTLSFTEETQLGQIDVFSALPTWSGWGGLGVTAPKMTSVEFSPDSSLFRGGLHARNIRGPGNLPTWEIQSIAVLAM